MTTWLPPDVAYSQRRLEAMEQALGSWEFNLRHNDRINLHVADDGSSPEDFEAIKDLVAPIWDRGIVTYSQQQRRGVGASLNAGLREAFQRSPIALHAVDDWQLLSALNLGPWVSFLEDEAYAPGMVRFFPHPDLTGEIKHVPPHGWAVHLDGHHFVFATRPCLWHQRFFDRYDWFAEGLNALDTELDFNVRVCQKEQPEQPIWLALPEQWRPIEAGSLAEVVPG